MHIWIIIVGAPLPSGLFDFTETELSIKPSLNDSLIPKWKTQGKDAAGDAVREEKDEK